MSINAVVGSNGVLNRAQEAVSATKGAELKEKVQLELVAKNFDGSYTVKDVMEVIEEISGVTVTESDILNGEITVEGVKVDISNITNEVVVNAGEYASSVSIYKDTEGNVATIPSGFTVSKVGTENLISKGLVIYQGDLSTANWTSSDLQKNYNQYVWIPCTEATFQRTEWGVEADNPDSLASNDEYNLLNVSLSAYDIGNGITTEVTNAIVEQMDKEHASVNKYGGFYISRYEIGDTENAAVTKKYQTPYASIKWKKAYTEAMKMNVGPSATSYLCSSYARDTAVSFIQSNSTFTNYATDRTGCNENWSDMDVTYIDATGTSQTKAAGTSTRLPTGVTLAKCNIYDLGGNVAEFTTELHPLTNGDNDATVVLRGGNYNNAKPAGNRWDDNSANANSNKGFRATLILFSIQEFTDFCQ